MVDSAQLLDVSAFQGKFDVAAAKARTPNLVGIIYKLTQGNYYINPDAKYVHDGCIANGLHGGGYHFMDPAIDGAEQCAYFMSEYEKLGMTETNSQWLDTETAKKGISAHQTSLVAQAFMTERGKLAPYNPHGVYTFVNFIMYGYAAGLGQYPLWLAFPAAKAPVPPPEWSKWTVWQWGERNSVDADAFNGTVAEFNAWVKSFGPKVPTGPQMHRMTGLKTWDQVAADFHTTGPLMLRETLAHVHGELSHGQRHLIQHLGPVRPEPGTEIWVP